MKTMKDSVIVVAGGTGYVGEGLVESFLSQGATVMVPYRTVEKADALKSKIPEEYRERLMLRHAVVSNEYSIESLVDRCIRELDHIDAAVASLGGWYYGYSLHRMPLEDWDALLLNNLTTHFMFMRPIMKHFYSRNEGEYLMINGGAAELVVPESGADSIVAAAQKMMARVLREEAHGTNINVSALIATQPIKTRERKIDNVEHWLGAREVGDYIGKILTGEATSNQDGVFYLGTR